MAEEKSEQPTVPRLLRQLVPLAMSDVIMALGDPMQISTVSRLSNPKASLAAMGVVKALANFLESPIIMILQTSTALSGDRRARHCLARFVLLLALLCSGTSCRDTRCGRDWRPRRHWMVPVCEISPSRPVTGRRRF